MTKKDLKELEELIQGLSILDAEIQSINKKMDASDVFSNSFVKRALAIVGHHLAFWLVLWVGLAAIAFLADL